MAYDIAKAKSDLAECSRDLATYELEASTGFNAPDKLKQLGSCTEALCQVVRQL
jgi:hypothetical protein